MLTVTQVRYSRIHLSYTRRVHNIHIGTHIVLVIVYSLWLLRMGSTSWVAFPRGSLRRDVPESAHTSQGNHTGRTWRQNLHLILAHNLRTKLVHSSLAHRWFSSMWAAHTSLDNHTRALPPLEGRSRFVLTSSAACCCPDDCNAIADVGLRQDGQPQFETRQQKWTYLFW